MTTPHDFLKRWLNTHKHHFMFEKDYPALKQMALDNEKLQEALHISHEGEFAELDALHDELHAEYVALEAEMDDIMNQDELPDDMDAVNAKLDELADKRDELRLTFEKEAVKFFANNTDAQISVDALFD